MDEDKSEQREYYSYRRLLRQKLSPTEYLVYDILADMASEKNNGWCWPGYGEISELAGGLDPHTISNAVQHLEEIGILTVQRPEGLRRKRSNRYYPIKLPTPEIVITLEKFQRNHRIVGKIPVMKTITLEKIQWYHWKKSSATDLIERI